MELLRFNEPDALPVSQLMPTLLDFHACQFSYPPPKEGGIVFTSDRRPPEARYGACLL